MTEVTLNGNTYTDGPPEGGKRHLAQGGHRDNFILCLGDMLADLGIAMSTTSSTSRLIGTGSKTFTMAEARPYAEGAYVKVSSRADPSSDWMWGQVTDRTGTSLTVNVTEVGGSGTKTDWDIGLSGPKGPDGDVANPMTTALDANGNDIDDANLDTCTMTSCSLANALDGNDKEIQDARFKGHSEPVNAMSAIDAADRDAICLSQTRASAGSLIINGTKGPTTATLNQGRKIRIYSATGNNTGITFTISGTNAETGNSDTEGVTGPGIGLEVTSTKYFSVITDVSVDGALSGNVEVGQGDALVDIDLAYGACTLTVGANVGKTILSNVPATGNLASSLVELTNPAAWTWPTAQANSQAPEGQAFSDLFPTSSGVDVGVVWTRDGGTTQNWGNSLVAVSAMS